MNFWRVSFAIMTYFLTSSSCSKISSMTCTFRVMSFSLLLCVACFIVLCVASNSPITLISSSSSGTNHCWRIFCCSLIWYISMYDYLLTRMVIMRSSNGSVLMLSEALCAFSYTSLNLASTTFIFGYSIICVQICVPYSHNFTHSPSILLILTTEVIMVLYLSAFYSGGVPGAVRDSKSSILMWKPLMTSLIFETCSSSVASTTIGISGISL
jgi:hypothetical protein